MRQMTSQSGYRQEENLTLLGDAIDIELELSCK